MKRLLVSVALLLFAGISYGAEGQLAYESASSSVTWGTVTITTNAPVLVSPTEAASLTGTGKKVTWYSITIYNVSSSSAVYAISGSETTAPALTCSNGIPIGNGTPTSPYWVTEQFQGMYMWIIACATESMTLRKIVRGR